MFQIGVISIETSSIETNSIETNSRLTRVIEAPWQQYESYLRAIREQVFVCEQQVDRNLEYDGLDSDCQHILAYVNDGVDPIGTARLTQDGQIGRMAVLAGYRKLGVGTALLHKIVQLAKVQPVRPIWLSAQTQAIDFYAKHNFVCTGAIYEEASMLHCKMYLNT